MWKPELKPYSSSRRYKRGLRKYAWERVIKLGKEREPEVKGITWEDHGLDRDDINTVLGTIQFFSNRKLFKLSQHDLIVAKYRLFDFIGMLLDGRDLTKKYPNSGNLRTTEVLTYSYLKSESLEDFIRDLRVTDYQIVKPKLKEAL